MNTEQERADFEAWADNHYYLSELNNIYLDDDYVDPEMQAAWEGYQAGRAALQSQPNTGELPHQSREAVLRAMSRNYTPGKHTWDSLDSDACAKGADEIRQLRAALAMQSQDREVMVPYEVVVDVANKLLGVEQYERFMGELDHARRIEGES